METDSATAAERGLHPYHFGKLVDGVYWRRRNPAEPPPKWLIGAPVPVAQPATLEPAESATSHARIDAVPLCQAASGSPLQRWPKDPLWLALCLVMGKLDLPSLVRRVMYGPAFRGDPIPEAAAHVLAQSKGEPLAALPEPFLAGARAALANETLDLDLSRVSRPLRAKAETLP